MAPSISAAVRIIAPRMSPDASGCRAIASTAWPPMRPMPIPAPMIGEPDADARAEQRVGVEGDRRSAGAWSSCSMYHVSPQGRRSRSKPASRRPAASARVHQADEDLKSAARRCTPGETPRTAPASIMNSTRTPNRGHVPSSPSPGRPCRRRKIKPSSDRMTKWPAVMLANNRSISANGFTSFPISSTGVMISVMQDPRDPRGAGRHEHDRPEVAPRAQRHHPRDFDHHEGGEREAQRSRRGSRWRWPRRASGRADCSTG